MVQWSGVRTASENLQVYLCMMKPTKRQYHQVSTYKSYTIVLTNPLQIRILRLWRYPNLHQNKATFQKTTLTWGKWLCFFFVLSIVLLWWRLAFISSSPSEFHNKLCNERNSPSQITSFGKLSKWFFIAKASFLVTTLSSFVGRETLKEL